MTQYLPKVGDHVIAGVMSVSTFNLNTLFFGTVAGFFKSDKKVTVNPQPPYDPDILHVEYQQEYSQDDIAKTFGSTTDKTIYVNDIVVARNTGNTFTNTIQGYVVGIFPDDSIAIRYDQQNGTYLFRIKSQDVSVSSNGWGRWKFW